MEKKKLMFVHVALWTGGIETALVNLLNHLDYTKYEATCLILSNYTEIADRITPNCKVVVADRNTCVSFPNDYRWSKLFELMQDYKQSSPVRKLLAKMLRVLQPLENSAYLRYIANNLKQKKYDAVIAYSNKAGEAAVRIFEAPKYVMFYHYGDLRRTYHDDIAYKKCDTVYAVSEGIASGLKNYLPQYADKIKVFPNLTNAYLVRQHACQGNAEEISEDGITIASCGRLVQDKGFDLAAEACRTLLDAGYEKLRWYIIGTGEEKDALQAKVRELNLEDRFILLGLKVNPYPYIAACDIFVQSSRIESFGLTITEAAILGKPIISTRTDGGKALLQDKVNGSLCEVDADSIASAVKQLLDLPDLANQYREYWESYDFEADNDKIMSMFYEDLKI